ncbi:MAG: hypothetical protein HGA45_22685 [Chloroflexales bacterium]|nr:hypothetical protein [Chloroflexales bacterium]
MPSPVAEWVSSSIRTRSSPMVVSFSRCSSAARSSARWVLSSRRWMAVMVCSTLRSVTSSASSRRSRAANPA